MGEYDTLLVDLLELLPRIAREAPEFVSDRQFVQGVIVELTGSVIELAALSVLLPLVWGIWKNFQSRRPRSIVQTRFLDTYSKLVDIFLDLGSLGSFQDRVPILLKEHDKNPRGRLTRYGFNDSLAQRLIVVKESLLSDIPAYRALIEQRSLDDLRRHRSVCQMLTEDLHHLATLVNHFPTLQSNILFVDTVVRGLLELFEFALKHPAEHGMDRLESSRLVDSIGCIVGFIDKDYRRREQLIDSVRSWGDLRRILPLLFRLPFILAYRFIGIRWSMMRGRRYHDPWAESSVVDLLGEWQARNGYSDTKAAAELGIQVGEYQTYLCDYKRPTGEALATIANRVYSDFRRWRSQSK